jgi:hypothetical protein
MCRRLSRTFGRDRHHGQASASVSHHVVAVFVVLVSTATVVTAVASSVL